MTLRHFQIFRAVCQTGGITPAADRLNMTQPAVSIAVKELEAFYQTRLFERMNRRVYLTQSGRALLQYVENVLGQYEESVEVVRSDRYPTRCRMGVNVTLAETSLGALVRAIHTGVPNLGLQILVNDTEAIERMIAENELDLAVVDKMSEEPTFCERLLYTETMDVVCSPALDRGSLTVAELAGQPLLLREKGSGSRNCVDAVFFGHGCTVQPIVESISTLALIRLAESGLGYTILPHGIAQKEAEPGNLRTVLITDGAFTRYYHLIYHKNKYLTDPMKAVIAQIERSAAEHVSNP